MLKSRTSPGKTLAALGRRLWRDPRGQVSVEYVLAILVLAVAMGYALPPLFEALGELFKNMGNEFAKPYP